MESVTGPQATYLKSTTFRPERAIPCPPLCWNSQIKAFGIYLLRDPQASNNPQPRMQTTSESILELQTCIPHLVMTTYLSEVPANVFKLVLIHDLSRDNQLKNKNIKHRYKKRIVIEM